MSLETYPPDASIAELQRTGVAGDVLPSALAGGGRCSPMGLCHTKGCAGCSSVTTTATAGRACAATTVGRRSIRLVGWVGSILPVRKPAAAAPAAPAAPVERYTHPKFGAGTLIARTGAGDGATLELRFDDGVTRKILARFLALEPT